MKLVYFANSNMRSTEAGRRELAKREEKLKQMVGPGVDISIVDNPEGPLSLESAKDEIQALPGTARNLMEARSRGVDAGILGCAVDPGIHSLRELVTFPLVGPGHASVHMAALLGNRFSVFSPLESTIAPTRKMVEDTGLLSHLGSIRSIDIPVLEIRTEPEKTLQKVTALGERMIVEDDADALILCCMSMAFQGVAKDLSQRLGVSVIDPVAVAVTLAESLARIGLSHSPRFYHRGAGGR